MQEYIINLLWDAEAGVWYAINDEIPMALESKSIDTLIERVKLATPELLELNGKDSKCTLHFIAERKEDVA
jgi:hypothetical protein